jgi:preprotein translocase subunit SecG
MELIVLSIHLLVCICLIGLVLLQRSEGGALGMGGGGGGGLVSGRGAADALARMTSVAGGFFLVTSLGLTMLSGAASSSEGRSVLDIIPAQSAPATTPAPVPAAPPATTEPQQQSTDPTESRASSSTQLVSIGPSEAAAATRAPAPSAATTRAGPIDQRQSAAVQRQNTTQPRQTTSTANTQTPRTTPASTQPRTTTPAPQRSNTGTTQPAATQPAAARTNPPPATTTNGAVSGIDLTTDPQIDSESSEPANGVTVVRRERAGPDQ